MPPLLGCPEAKKLSVAEVLLLDQNDGVGAATLFLSHVYAFIYTVCNKRAKETSGVR